MFTVFIGCIVRLVAYNFLNKINIIIYCIILNDAAKSACLN